MRRRFLISTKKQNNKIWYTSTDNNVVTPYRLSFGANIISNIYENDEGIITFDMPVKHIGYMAFNSCSSLKSVIIPDSVTEIGESALEDCSSLASVTIPDSVTSIKSYAFSGCTSLTSVTIGNGVTEIGHAMFSDCTSLTSITIPDSVTEIKVHAFYYCTSLTSVTIGNGVTWIGNGAFYGCGGELIINSKIVEENYSNGNYPQRYGWLREAKFTKLTIGDNVTSIGKYAFAYCTSLKSVTIPNSVIKIGDYAFYDCISLANVTIPNSVTSIGQNAFTVCSSLTSIIIPDSVTTIGDNAFEYCYSLTSVYCKSITPPTSGSNMFSNNASGRKIYVPRASVNAYKSANGWSDYADAIVGYDF